MQPLQRFGPPGEQKFNPCSVLASQGPKDATPTTFLGPRRSKHLTPTAFWGFQGPNHATPTAFSHTGGTKKNNPYSVLWRRGKQQKPGDKISLLSLFLCSNMNFEFFLKS